MKLNDPSPDDLHPCCSSVVGIPFLLSRLSIFPYHGFNISRGDSVENGAYLDGIHVGVTKSVVQYRIQELQFYAGDPSTPQHTPGRQLELRDMADLVDPPDMVAHEKDVERIDSQAFGESIAYHEREEGYVVDKQLERKLLRKFDFFILPLVALMYLFKYGTTLSSGEMDLLTNGQFH